MGRPHEFADGYHTSRISLSLQCAALRSQFATLAIHGKSVKCVFGYAQVLNSTWASYLKANHLSFASRSDFFAATDFIGWYVNQLHQQLGLALSDGLHLYLAYHEGVTGYRKSMYKHKPWLISVARKVQRQALAISSS